MSGKAEPDELTLKIARHLEIDHQYVRHVEPTDVEQIAEIRAAGRRAGRLLGWKIMTHQSDPRMRDDGLVVVIVSIRDYPNEEEQQRMRERGDLITRTAIDAAFRSVRGSREDLS